MSRPSVVQTADAMHIRFLHLNDYLLSAEITGAEGQGECVGNSLYKNMYLESKHLVSVCSEKGCSYALPGWRFLIHYWC